MTRAVLLVAHGTVDDLSDVPEFLTNIARGRPPAPELLEEVRRRYQVIGGSSPLNRINRELATKLEARLGVPVRLANRLFRPYPKDVLGELAALGVRTIDVVPLAQHSAYVYGDAVKAAAREHHGDAFEVAVAPNWGRHPKLIEAFATNVVRALDAAPSDARTALVLTAHSLPRSVIDAGDPYEREFRASAEDVASAVRAARPDALTEHVVAFQSQGMSSGSGGRTVAWLGPDLKSSFEDLARRGNERVVVAPVGFLADHVEIFYDLDVEAKALAEGLGLSLLRSASLNAEAALVDVLADVATQLAGARRPGGFTVE